LRITAAVRFDSIAVEYRAHESDMFFVSTTAANVEELTMARS
jgi:hypothetical protein